MKPSRIETHRKVFNLDVFTIGCFLLYFGLSVCEEDFICYSCASIVNDKEQSVCPFNTVPTYDFSNGIDCKGHCFYRLVAGQDGLIIRNCTDNQPGLPETLPDEDGCFDWENSIFCVCKDFLCNYPANVGESNGKSLNYSKPTTKGDTTSTAEITTATRTTTATEPVKTTATEPVKTTATEPVKTTATTTQIVSVKTTLPVTKVPPPKIDDKHPIICVQCQNYFNNTPNDSCPKDKPVVFSKVGSGNCTGPCFTRSDAQDSNLVFRGCTVNIKETLPSKLPNTGCYTWNGATFCVCYTPNCNYPPLGKSSNVPLDVDEVDFEPNPGDPFQCYECTNYNTTGARFLSCDKDKKVATHIAFRNNCTGVCFTKSFVDNPDKVSRGCTSNLWGMPSPLPPPGCYIWNDETFCICNKSLCNSAALGKSTGTELDAHLYTENIVETDGVNKCYQCRNYDGKVFYRQCPKDANVRNAYLAPCNGSCYTRTYDQDDRLVARGCSDYLPGLPKPLPPDGCYTWYTEIWCVCSTSRCNFKAIGQAQNIEFDAHIPKPNGSPHNVDTRKQAFILPFLVLIFVLKFHMNFNL